MPAVPASVPLRLRVAGRDEVLEEMRVRFAGRQDEEEGDNIWISDRGAILGCVYVNI